VGRGEGSSAGAMPQYSGIAWNTPDSDKSDPSTYFPPLS